MIKTNKSFSKRIRVTRTGKLLARKAGQNHFNAKESRRTKTTKRRSVIFTMSKKARSRFMPGK